MLRYKCDRKRSMQYEKNTVLLYYICNNILYITLFCERGFDYGRKSSGGKKD